MVLLFQGNVMGGPGGALLLVAAMASAVGYASSSAVAPVVGSGDEWMMCQHSCTCKWVSGKKTADCSRRDLSAVPHGLSGQIQSLDLARNKLRVLPSAAFRSVGLVNLHKINLEGCSLADVHEYAFQGLAILTELDLSNNNVSTTYFDIRSNLSSTEWTHDMGACSGEL